MDYTLLKRTFQAYLADQTAIAERLKEQIAQMTPEDSFEKKLLGILTHITECFETNEILKKIMRDIVAEGDFFANDAIHKTTKTKFFEKILKDNQFRENSRQFNLDAMQTYVSHVLQKQLYEINIKIEENQRSLNKLEAAVSAQSRSAALNISDAIPASKKQTASPSQSTDDIEVVNATARKQSGPEENKTSEAISQGLYLLVEVENRQCAVQYADIVEILKFDKAVPDKVLTSPQLPHQKLLAFNRRNVLKEMAGGVSDKKVILSNANASMENRSAKHFGLILKKTNSFLVLFVDYIEYTEPVKAQVVGDAVNADSGEYKIIPVKG